jgi:hypothetical protein
MLTLLSKASPKQSARLAHYGVKLARKLGAIVRDDKDSNRYFIQSGGEHYILSSRSRKKRPVEVVEGSTYKAYHAGYISLYKENRSGRNVHDIQRRDVG